MNKPLYVLFIIICLIGFGYVYFVFNGIEMNIKSEDLEATPPQLTDIFPDREEGPHQMFVSEEACLACHQESITIPSVGKTPKIKHEFRKNCTTCHLFPGEQI